MFKYPVPERIVTVRQYARQQGLKEPTARYHLEKMLTAGVVTKQSYWDEVPKRHYNPAATHMIVHGVEYVPVKKVKSK